MAVFDGPAFPRNQQLPAFEQPPTLPLFYHVGTGWPLVAFQILDRSPAEHQQASTITVHNSAITRALAFASEQLGNKEWCEGTAITLADLAMVSALIYLDLRQADRDWRGAHPNLAKWFSRISERNSMHTVLAE